jgi:hypothetical protein
MEEIRWKEVADGEASHCILKVCSPTENEESNGRIEVNLFSECDLCRYRFHILHVSAE